MIDIKSPLQLLGGLSAEDFMLNYWQKKPLLIKSCINNYKPIISKNQLFTIAGQPDITCRLIQQNTKTKQWQVKNAPIKSMPKTANAWTLLVSNMNEYVDEIYAFMQKFAFIPYARLDDVMVSYANDGGSVGAHFDTYDVFLFQGMGKRKWQISSQTNLELLNNCPLKILKEFMPEQEWVLEEGDMLYLPPNYAHYGVAVGECMTYSVGFKAPKLKDLVFEYFMDMVALLEDYDIPDTIYTDTYQKATTKAGEIPKELANFLQKTLDNLSMPSASHLLGTYLTRLNTEIEIKQDILSFKKFCKFDTIYLHKASKANYDNEYFYINGEHSTCDINQIILLQNLADKRELKLDDKLLPQNILQELYEWYAQGWIIGKSFQ